MASLSALPYETRASKHRHPLARQLFNIALEKKSNVVVSADVTTSKELLNLADRTSFALQTPRLTSTRYLRYTLQAKGNGKSVPLTRRKDGKQVSAHTWSS